MWLSYAVEIEHDLEVYRQRNIGDWFSGKMSSRKLLVYLAGLLATEPKSWYANTVRRDYQKIEVEKQAAQERLMRAEHRAQIRGAPLEMSDLEP